jgi:predicted GNAT family acetyltransferase
MHAAAMTSPYLVERHPDLAAFRAAAFDWLAAREAEHNLPLGVLSGVDEAPTAFGPGPPVLLTVRRPDDGAVLAAAIRTPPWRLILSEVDDPAALAALADAVVAADPGVPGLVGPAEHAGELATLLATRLGRRAERGLSERTFRLSQVIPPRPTTGHARLAGPRDRALVIDWIDAFEREAIADSRPSDADDADAAAALAARVDRAIGLVGSRRIWLWDDGGPVSLTGLGGATPTGIRLGPVYTPPALRGRGYASALVAAASQAALDAGRRFVFLFTDLANPTSNHIYQELGYEPVRDLDEWSLRPLDGS